MVHPTQAGANFHLPPHVREVCGFLAAGLTRLRRQMAEKSALDMRDLPSVGESSLHFSVRQSFHGESSERDRA